MVSWLLVSWFAVSWFLPNMFQICSKSFPNMCQIVFHSCSKYGHHVSVLRIPLLENKTNIGFLVVGFLVWGFLVSWFQKILWCFKRYCYHIISFQFHVWWSSLLNKSLWFVRCLSFPSLPTDWIPKYQDL